MRESLLITGTIVAVAATAAVVSAPAILNHAGSHPIPSLPAPSSVFPVPTSGPLSVIASPPEAVPPAVPLPATAIPSVGQPPSRPVVHPSAASTAPATGTSEPVPPGNNTCLISLVLDPLLGICVG